jgi:hypothetical protein
MKVPDELVEIGARAGNSLAFEDDWGTPEDRDDLRRVIRDQTREVLAAVLPELARMMMADEMTNPVDYRIASFFKKNFDLQVKPST